MSETAVEDPTEEPKTKEPEEPAQDDGDAAQGGKEADPEPSNEP
ncbi:MAG TPA: hypothetical protein VII57_06015 [Dehalococcoidia bacterium]